MNYLSNLIGGVGYAASFLNPWAYGSSGQLSQASIEKFNNVLIKAIEDLKNDGCKVIKKSSLLVEHVVKFQMNELEASIHFNFADPKSVQIAIHRKVEQLEMKTLLAKPSEKSPSAEEMYLENFDNQGKADLYTRTVVSTAKEDKVKQLKDLTACFTQINQKSEKPSLTLAQASSALQKNQWVIFKDKACPTKVLKDELQKAEQIFAKFVDMGDVKLSLETVVYEMNEQTQNELFKVKHPAADAAYEFQFKKGAIATEGQLIANLEAIKDKANIKIEPKVGLGKPSYNLYEAFVVEKKQFDKQFPEAFKNAKKSVNS